MIKKILVSLKRKGFFSFLPDKLYYTITYHIHCKGWINWEHPRTYSEKLNWLKLYDRRPLYQMIVDKCEVRNYIKEKIGEDILLKMYGVYSSFDEINFEELPEKFVLKCTHDSGSVRIVDKKTVDIKELSQFFNKKMGEDFFQYSGREWPYKNLQHRIIAEEFLKMPDGTGLTNYKFHCFNGEPKFVVAEQGFNAEHSIKLDHYDFDFNLMPFRRPEHKPLGKDVVKPTRIKDMIEISKKLSKNIPYLRVDLYEISGKIYFSELTLYPGAGFVWFKPDEWNVKIGDMIDISAINKN